MAVLKIHVVRARLDKRINYVMNPKKTACKGFHSFFGIKDTLTSGFTCACDEAYQQMMETKQHEKKTDKVLGYHYIQSFKPGEVTPEEAHQVGCEFIERCFAEDFEVVIGTHTDHAHIHNHIILNSVSFVDGHKFQSTPASFYKLRAISDEIGYFTTGADGKFTIPYADSGTYTFREYHTLAGYVLNKEPITIEHTTDGNVDLVVDNTVQKKFEVVKVDSQTKQPLAGVQFKIWRDSVLLGDYTTDENGKITIEKAPAGTYKVQEVATLKEYILNDKPYEIEHTTDKDTSLTVHHQDRRRNQEAVVRCSL